MSLKPALGSDFGAFLMGTLRVMGFFGLILALTPPHCVYVVCRGSNRYKWPLIFHRMLMKLLGFRVRVHGAMAETSPVLFVANHASYLDIPVLGAIIPAAFVAKAEVANWPLFGILAKLQNTVFIERRVARTLDHKEGLQARMEQGQSLILFPEGTSSDGLQVLPFRSGLFAAVEQSGSSLARLVQPVSICCTALDDLPITRAWRPYYAWFGDMTLVGHLWAVFKLGRFTVDVVFHPPVSLEAFPDRKALAVHCHQQVAHGVELCLTGRHMHPEIGLKFPAPIQKALAAAPQA
jgi:1-acyl-sn-glycerol-3-phosphate acyltransferase